VSEAVEWLKRSADGNNKLANMWLKQMYKSGLFGTKTNEAEETARLEFAVERFGDPVAAYELGEKNLAANVAVAAEWYKKAGDNLPPVQYRLGQIHLSGLLDGAKDCVRAAEYFNAAAEGGDVRAPLYLAYLYDVGCGVQRDASLSEEMFTRWNTNHPVRSLGIDAMLDDPTTRRWFLGRAADCDRYVQFEIGYYFLERSGPELGGMRPSSTEPDEVRSFFDYWEPNFREAAKWLRRSAEKGHGEAQARLAELFLQGKGVPENFVEAYKWLILAEASESFAVRDLTQRRAALRDAMSSGQVAEAQRLAAAWEATHASGGAGVGDGNAVVGQGGSGFFVSADGFILTAGHVVEGSMSIEIDWGGGTAAARCVAIDKVNDLAILKADGDFKCLPIAGHNSTIGEDVFTVGFPNVDIQGRQPKLTKGTISGMAGIMDDPRMYQVSVPAQPGNSGGPLLNGAGEVVGVLVGSLDSGAMLALSGALPQNVNYAVKSEYVLAFLRSIPEARESVEKLAPCPSSRSNGDFSSVLAASVLVVVH
jgi:TPR repeat protein